MHEYSLARSLVTIASEEGQRAGAERVTQVNCRIGVRCGLDSTLLDEAFRETGRGTLCDGAQLRIERIAARSLCARCGRHFSTHNNRDRCPSCGTACDVFSGGEELELSSIEVEARPAESRLPATGATMVGSAPGPQKRAPRRPAEPATSAGPTPARDPTPVAAQSVRH